MQGFYRKTSAQRQDQRQEFIQFFMGLKRIEQRELQADIAVADRLPDHHAFVVQKFAADTFVDRIG